MLGLTSRWPRSTGTRWARGKAVAGAVVLLLAAGVFIYRVAAAWSTVPYLGFDLGPLYVAGQAVRAARPLFAVRGFVYAPSSALALGTPLSLLPGLGVAHGALAAGPLLVVATVLVAARTVRTPLLGAPTVLAVAIAALSSAVQTVLQLENLSLLVGLLTAGAFYAWSRGRDVLAGALLGCTLAVKPVLLPLWVGLVVVRRWRSLAAATAVPVALNLLALAVDPAALGGWRTVVDQYLNHTGLYGGYFFLYDASITSVGTLLGWWGGVSVLLRLLVAAAAVAGAAAIWRARPEPFRSLEAGGLLVAGFWLSSQVMENHWVLMLVPFAFAAVDTSSPLRSWPVALGGVFAAELVVVPGSWTRYGVHGAATIGLCLGLCLVVLAVTAASLWPVVAGRRATPKAGAAPAPVQLR